MNTKAKLKESLCIRVAAMFLVYAVWSNLLGWGLSAAHQLKPLAYAVLTPLLVAGWVGAWKCLGGGRLFSGMRWKRWRRPEVALWGMVAILAFAGGVMHAPANFDGVTYRLPRILYWAQQHGWHWIGAAEARLDYNAACFEWMMLPMIFLLKSDRWIFLLNWIPYVILPSLCFLSLRSLSVKSSVAARWMWWLPCMYGLAMQAGSIGNDAIAAWFALACMAFAARAQRSGSIVCWSLAMMSAACMTALKASNLPLLLPLLVHAVIMLRRASWSVAWPKLIPWMILAAFVSFLPTAILNQIHCGDWAGDPQNLGGMRVTEPLRGLVGNVVSLITGSLEMPVLPFSRPWNQALDLWESTSGWVSWVREGFPRFSVMIGGEIPAEEYSGIGVGVTTLLFLSYQSRNSPLSLKRITKDAATLREQRAFMAAMLVAVGVFMIKMGSELTARMLIPYSPLLFAVVLMHVRRVSHLRAYCLIFPAMCVLPGLIFTPNRPLVNGQALASLPFVSAPLRERMNTVYQTYSKRSDALGELRDALPNHVSTVGFGGFADSTPLALFRPYGTRKVYEITTGNPTPGTAVVITDEGMRLRLGMNVNQYIEKYHMKILSQSNIRSKIGTGYESWYVLMAQ